VLADPVRCRGGGPGSWSGRGSASRLHQVVPINLQNSGTPQPCRPIIHSRDQGLCAVPEVLEPDPRTSDEEAREEHFSTQDRANGGIRAAWGFRRRTAPELTVHPGCQSNQGHASRDYHLAVAPGRTTIDCGDASSQPKPSSEDLVLLDTGQDGKVRGYDSRTKFLPVRLPLGPRSHREDRRHRPSNLPASSRRRRDFDAYKSLGSKLFWPVSWETKCQLADVPSILSRVIPTRWNGLDG